MNLLIIGNIGSTFILNFAKSLIQFDPLMKVSIINTGKLSVASQLEEHTNLFEHIFNINVPNSGLIQSIPKVRGLVSLLKKKKTEKKIDTYIDQFDTVVLHGFSLSNIKQFNRLKIKHQKTIGAFWGSDFYLANQNTLKLIETTCKQLDNISIATNQMRDDVLAKINIEYSKIRICLFGVAPLQSILDLTREAEVDKLALKEEFEVPNQKIVITCGYNANSHQQHIQVITAIQKLPQSVLENLYFIFPLTYPNDTPYIQKLQQHLEVSGLDYMMLTEFMSDEKVAKIRLLSDIFLNLQKTDANSGTMQEYFLAQNIVIAGKWLPYQRYKDKGVFFVETEDIADLSQTLEHTIDNYEKLVFKVKNSNLPDKFTETLWSNTIKCWYKVIKE